MTWAFFEPSVMGGGGGGGHEGPHHNFVVIALMIMKFGTGIKLDVFTWRRASKDCKRSIQRQVLDEVSKKNVQAKARIGSNH